MNVIDDIESAIRSAISSASDYQSQLETIFFQLEQFIVQKPEPPQSWKDTVGDNAHKFEYHQVVLPDSLIDPYQDELENIRRLASQWNGSKFMALEHELLTHNKIIHTHNHYPPIYCPKPLLVLESIPESEEVDWDCFLSIFADGSFQSFNILRDQSEEIGQDGLDIFREYSAIIPKLQFHIPVEGYDYGFLKE
jgi:hypothetical protein